MPCCPKVAVSLDWPDCQFTQLSLYFTQKPCSRGSYSSLTMVKARQSTCGRSLEGDPKDSFRIPASSLYKLPLWVQFPGKLARRLASPSCPIHMRLHVSMSPRIAYAAHGSLEKDFIALNELYDKLQLLRHFCRIRCPER